MEFQKNDLLNFKEIKSMIDCIFPNELANIMKIKLSKYCFITSCKDIYTLQKNISYNKSTNVDDTLVTYATLMLEQSYKNLSEDDSERIRDKYPKSWQSIFQNTSIKKYLPQLIANLSSDEIELDSYFDEIHFNNGVKNLVTKEFKKREINKHFITKFVRRDYVPSTKKQREKIMTKVSKIYPVQADRKAIIMELAKTLTGRAANDQSTLFLLGMGSAGKSVIMEITGAAIDIYMKELQDDTFSAGNSNLSKILNTFQHAKYIRIAWLNEPKDTKMNDTGFKNFCDGKACTVMLYKDEQYNFKLYCKAIISANTMPALIINSGITRRIEAFTHTSHFTLNKDEVNEKEHKYLRDNNLLENIKKECLLDAWFDILVEHCANGEDIVYTDNFKETKQTIVDSNDTIKDFVDAHLVITNDPTNRIGKNAMHKYFGDIYPTKHLSIVQVINSLKEKSLKYDCKARSDSMQGSFMGVRFRRDIDGDKVDDKDYDNGVDKTDKSVNIKEEYEKKIKELENINKKLIIQVQFNEIMKLNDLYNNVKLERDEQLKHVQNLVLKKRKIPEQIFNEVDEEFQNILNDIF